MVLQEMCDGESDQTAQKRVRVRKDAVAKVSGKLGVAADRTISVESDSVV